MSYLRLLVFILSGQTTIAANFTVNSESDWNDTDPKDKICLTSQGTCTLRAGN